jgi:hypothetical protein
MVIAVESITMHKLANPKFNAKISPPPIQNPLISMQNSISLSQVPQDIFPFLRRFISVAFYSNFALKEQSYKTHKQVFQVENLFM